MELPGDVGSPGVTPGPKAPAHTEAALKLTLASRGQGAFWPGFPSNDSLFPGVGAGPVLCPEVPASACSYLTRFFFFFFWSEAWGVSLHGPEGSSPDMEGRITLGQTIRQPYPDDSPLTSSKS